MKQLTTPITNSQELLTCITGGAFDAELKAIEQAISFRTQLMHPKPTTAGFKVGQTVWFNERVNPKYLMGVEAVVVDVKRVRVVVDIVDKRDAGRFQGRTKCPTYILTSVKPI